MKIEHVLTPIQDENLGITIYRKTEAVELFENTDSQKNTIKIEMRVTISQYSDPEMTIPFEYQKEVVRLISVDNTTIVNKNTGEWIENNGVTYQENALEEDKITELDFYQNLLSQFIVAGLDRRNDI